jgi:ABC-type transport system involved in multi-copper enzyme maturation permease subunit
MTTVSVSPVTQARVLRSEWIKMRSLRSTGLTLLAAVVAMIGIGCLVGYATNLHWDERDRPHFEPIARSLVGVNLAQLAIGVLGVLLISGEYSTGMIRATFAAVPTRLPVLWAKGLLYAVVTFALMLAAAFAAFLGGQHFLASHGTTLSAPHAVASVFGVAGYLTLVGLLALALGFIVRSTAGGIATYVGLLLVLPGIGQVLPSDWRNNTLPYLPSNAGSSMFTPSPEDPAALSAGTGLVVLLIWVAVAIALAAVVVRRRDA